MNLLQYYLGKLAEEGSEVAQIALKTSQFGGQEVLAGQPHTNFERCHLELDDLAAAVEELNEKFGFGYEPSRERIEGKKAKMLRYLQYSVDLGMVDVSSPPVNQSLSISNLQRVGSRPAAGCAEVIKATAAYQYLFDGPYGEVWMNTPTDRNGAKPKARRELVVQSPDWIPHSHEHLQYFGLAGELWLALVTGEVVVGRYHWEQGHDPHGFQTLEMGRVAASAVSHYMPYARPAHPGVPT